MAAEQTADHIPWEEYLRVLWTLKDEKRWPVYLLSLLGGFWGLRVSELLTLRWEDILDKDILVIAASKGGKRREIRIIPDVRSEIRQGFEAIHPVDKRREVFRNQATGRVYTTHYFNHQLKSLKERTGMRCGNISTHSLRKTFGRKYIEDNQFSDYSFSILGELFRHESAWVTKRYLGITGDEVGNVYENFQLKTRKPSGSGRIASGDDS